MKASGEKINDDAKKDIERMMVQLNHEHTELKRQLERKNQQVVEQVKSAQNTGETWTHRLGDAAKEFEDGAKRAWHKISPGEDRAHGSNE